eukprot:CAMPEP_0174891692 /NCGR_PEP_ID=MMETSP0167-20121228/6741_1 /TAXON_ID=38298 /ORGANISM="Rhodella maculata, Strain CCMP736" /LENGTH=121 /DNA_ID=CAMNT_0016129961 /DNA_START=356 /DNA_END=718 /DNA_ORIENTATION=+
MKGRAPHDEFTTCYKKNNRRHHTAPSPASLFLQALALPSFFRAVSIPRGPRREILRVHAQVFFAAWERDDVDVFDDAFGKVAGAEEDEGDGDGGIDEEFREFHAHEVARHYGGVGGAGVVG